MPSYVFRVRTPDKIVHRAECRELPDLDAALVEASRSARTLIRNPVRRGILTIGGSLDIENESEQAIARVMLREVALQIS